MLILEQSRVLQGSVRWRGFQLEVGDVGVKGGKPPTTVS